MWDVAGEAVVFIALLHFFLLCVFTVCQRKIFCCFFFFTWNNVCVCLLVWLFFSVALCIV